MQKENRMFKITLSLLCCGMLIVGCARPTAPELMNPGSGGYTVVAKLSTPGFAQDVDVIDTLAYVAEGEGGLAVISIADPTNPKLLSLCYMGVRGYSFKIARRDSIVFLATGGFGLNTVNVGDPYAPRFIWHTGNSASTNEVAVFRDWLLEAKGEAGIRFSNVAELEPGYIDPRGSILTPGYAHGMVGLADSTLLVTCGEMGLAVYDLRDIGWYGGEGGGWYDERKERSGWIDLPGYAVHVAAMGSRRVAFVACGTAGVQVVDFSDSTLKVIGAYSTGGYAKELVYHNGRLYVTTETRGLQILSVEDPAAPRMIAVIETKNAFGVASDGHYVYVADQNEGFIIIKIP
jgi:hypothetical protein